MRNRGPLKEFGEHLRRQRVAMGKRNRAAWARELGLPNDRVLNDLEHGTRDNYSDATLDSVDLWYRLPHGTAERVIRQGGTWDEEPTAQPTTTNAAGAVVPASRYDKSGRDLVADAYEQMRRIVDAGQAVLSDLEKLLEDNEDPPTRDRDRSGDPLSDPRA